MIRREGDRLYLSGAVTLANVTALLEQARVPLADGVRALAGISLDVREVDLGEVTELDSSLIAALLAWMREAKSRGQPLAFFRLPPDLLTLAQLYGVAQLLPQDAPH
jgi:phospholipid transport system transporter-binding protein